MCFNPSRCVHAVRNLGGWGDVVTSLTHNFVDATNLADCLEDATRSIRDELLPMAQSLKPKAVLKTLASTLHIKREALKETLLALPTLFSDERLDEVVAAAAAGAEGDDQVGSLEGGLNKYCGGSEVVSHLLRSELAERLKDVRPAFEAAATALNQALELG